jgi:hypothetical protein
MMRTWIGVRSSASAVAVTLAIALVVALSACSSSSPSHGASSNGAHSNAAHSRGVGSHMVTSPGVGSHMVTAAERGSGRSGSMTVTDPLAAGSKLQKIEYHLSDGYSKRVVIPGGAFVAAEDIAICGVAGRRYLNIGFVGTGLPCHPALHTVEVFYHQDVGDLVGRFRPHRNVEVTEIAHGSGRYLTVGHIDHGAMRSVEYYWANGEHLTVQLHGDVLIDHIVLITSGGRLGATVTRYG